MRQFSDESEDVRLWVAMTPELLQFQNAHGHQEFDLLRDAIDRKAIESGKALVVRLENSLRQFRPVPN